MKNEEIEKKAEELMEVFSSNCSWIEEFDSSTCKEQTAAALRSLVSQALEEAARAVCFSCEAGKPKVKVRNTWNNLGDYYIHPTEGMSADRTELHRLPEHESCDADEIHLLKDSLQAETVPA